MFLEKLDAAYKAGKLNFHGRQAHLADAHAFKAFLRPAHRSKWFVYAKRPFAGPKVVLAYLSRYTHRVAISNRRIIGADANTVTFKVKDYRVDGSDRYTRMTLNTGEFIRRFLIHVLPKGLHRIRHYGLFANGSRAKNLAKMRELLDVDGPGIEDNPDSKIESQDVEILAQPCPCCGGTMRIIELFEPGKQPRHIVLTEGIDSS